MKITVVGPGAMGCLLAASLSEHHQVRLLDHDPDRAALLNRRGLCLEDGGRCRHYRVEAAADPRRLGPAELVLLCVKSGAVRPILAQIPFLCDKNSLLIAFQNGIGHLAPLAELSADTAWALGVTAQGATLAGPGHVLHRGRGLTRIGLAPQLSAPKDEARAKLVRAARALSGAGIETAPVDDILNHVWAKLLINAGINALTVIHDCPNGALLDSPDAVAVMRAAILEGKEVAEKSGIYPGADPLKAAVEVCRATAANISSMLQDVRAKRLTEIDAINGALVRCAAELDIPVPVNRELTRKIKEIERGYDNFS